MESDSPEAFGQPNEHVEVRDNWQSIMFPAILYEEGINVPTDGRKMAELYERGTEFLQWQRPYYSGYYGYLLIRREGCTTWTVIRRSI